MRTKLGRQLLAVAPLAALMVSSLLNISLATRLSAVESKAKLGLKPGAAAPDLQRVNGAAKTAQFISVRGSRALVYHFSAKCGWCERNWPNMEALHRKMTGRLRVIGVSIDVLPPDFAESRGITFELVDGLSIETVDKWQLGATPQSLLVDSSGKITETWFGAYSGPVAANVRRLFGVDLPGLASVRSGPPRTQLR